MRVKLKVHYYMFILKVSKEKSLILGYLDKMVKMMMEQSNHT